MRRLVTLFGLTVCLHNLVIAQTAGLRLQPVGIARLSATNFAILEEGPLISLTQAGEKTEDRRGNKASVAAVSPETASITLTVNGEESVAQLKGEITLEKPAFVLFDGAGMSATVEIYSRCIKHTVLLHPNLFTLKFSAALSEESEAKIAEGIQEEWKKQGVQFLEVGPFTKVIPAKIAEAEKKLDQQVKFDEPATSADGFINFLDAPAIQAAEIYADLSGASLQGPPPNNAMNFNFRLSSEKLTRRQSLYALETLFRWNGFRVVDAGGNQVKLESIK